MANRVSNEVLLEKMENLYDKVNNVDNKVNSVENKMDVLSNNLRENDEKTSRVYRKLITGNGEKSVIEKLEEQGQCIVEIKSQAKLDKLWLYATIGMAVIEVILIIALFGHYDVVKAILKSIT